MLTPSWLPVAVFVFAASVGVLCHNQLSFLGLSDSRWTIAGILGASFAALMAPSLWIAAFVLCLAASIPVSLSLPRRNLRVGSPVVGAATLLSVSVWIVALALVSRSVRELGLLIPLALVLIALASFNNAFGRLQALRGVSRIRWAENYCGEPGAVVRAPTAFLHNAWKPAAINAVLLPTTLGLALQGGIWWALALPLAGMIWQMREAQGITAQAAAGVGSLAALIVSGWYLPAIIAAPLGLAAYPSARRKIRENPRLEAWAILLSNLRKSRGVGFGVGAWAAFAPETPKETGRRWYAAHNDWLETLHDAGPLPVLCVAGYLISASIQVSGGTSPIIAGLYGSLIALAVLSAGYMPWRAWPVNLFGLGILACWQAI